MKEANGQIRRSGWYTDICWTFNEYGAWKEGNGNSFIFALKDDKELIKLRCKKKNEEIIICDDLLSSFGDWDLWIYDDCNINYYSRSNLGRVYESPSEDDN